MARIRTVTARKNYICGRCQQPIQKGEKYHTWKNRSRPKQYRCKLHYPRMSETTTSEHLANLYGLQEGLEDGVKLLQEGTVEPKDLIADLENAAGEARNEGESYNESADNIDQYFPGSAQVDEIREKAEACETWAGYLEQAAEEIRNLDEEMEEESRLSEAIAVTEEAINSLEL